MKRNQSNQNKKTKRNAVRLAVIALLIVVGGSAAYLVAAQQTGTKRTDLQQHDISVPGYEAVQVRVDFDPGAAFPKHKHPGEEIVYVLEGTHEYQVGDQPPVTLKRGDVLFVPAGTFHSARNVGKENGAELATYIVEKGKPLVTLEK